jgi:hypothetical protein
MITVFHSLLKEFYADPCTTSVHRVKLLHSVFCKDRCRKNMMKIKVKTSTALFISVCSILLRINTNIIINECPLSQHCFNII